MNVVRHGLARVLVGSGLVLAWSAGVVADEPVSKSARVEIKPPAYLDEMIAESWKAGGIKPSPEAPPGEFMRRLYLDLLGRVPTIAEAEAYLNNKDAGKKAKLVEYLLSHPDYAKHFGTVFLNQLIGRKPQGRRVDKAALANWTRRQFAENRPWNEVARELVTAKGSSKDNGAVNFTLAHMEGDNVPLTSITTRVFLGQQIQCTQCHDHPSNDWKQKDFWGINAFFKGLSRQEVTRTDSTGAEVYDYTDLSDEPSDAYSTFEKRNAYMEIAFPTFLDGRKISQGTDVNRREALGKFLTDPSNDQFSRAFVNRLWGHFMGRGFVHPVDDFGDHNPPSHPELLDKLAADFEASGYDVKQLIRWIVASKPYQLTSVTTKDNEKDETLFSHMTLKPLTPEQLFDSLLTATQAHKTTGDYDKTRETWLGQFVVTFANDEEGEATFQGTIPQALMLMNGELMARATGGKSGSFLAKLLDAARDQNRMRVGDFIVNKLYLAALGRYPTQTEKSNAAKFFGTNPDTIDVIEDLFWALLNSNEFVLNR